MTEQDRTLSNEELATEEASELPDREAMSLVNANLAVPINAGIAANVLSDGATATGDATQTGNIAQGNL
jgi:hypothetical protein